MSKEVKNAHFPQKDISWGSLKQMIILVIYHYVKTTPKPCDVERFIITYHGSLD